MGTNQEPEFLFATVLVYLWILYMEDIFLLCFLYIKQVFLVWFLYVKDSAFLQSEL